MAIHDFDTEFARDHSKLIGQAFGGDHSIGSDTVRKHLDIDTVVVVVVAVVGTAGTAPPEFDAVLLESTHYYYRLYLLKRAGDHSILVESEYSDLGMVLALRMPYLYGLEATFLMTYADL